MGILYDLIKKDVEELKQYGALEHTDYMASKNYDVVLKAYNNNSKITALTTSIDYICRKAFGNSNNYSKFLKNNINQYHIPSFTFENNSHVEDYEKILNIIEEQLNEAQIKDIINQYDKNIKALDTTPTHIYEPKINEIKNEINSFSADLMNEEEKNSIIRSLDFANDILIKKNGFHYHDKVIDISSEGRNEELKRYNKEFEEKNNISLDGLTDYEKEKGIINISPTDTKRNNILKPFLNKKLNLSDKYKEKLLNLDKTITDNNVLNNVVHGESSFKEYGLTDWFIKARLLNDELKRYINSNEVDQNKKIENLRNISKLSNDLEDITKRYNNVINHIKNNFDLNKCSIPSNVYSGRIKNIDIGDNINNYHIDLPTTFDNENAPYGSILNGFSQIKAICNTGGITLQQFLDDPVNQFLNVCQKVVKDIDDTIILPRENNTLGKRMAHILVQKEKLYAPVTGLVFSAKCFDTLDKLQDLDENTYDNMALTLIASHYISPLDRSNELMFGTYNASINNFKNLFALGEDRDNLLSLSDKYLDKDFNYEDLNTLYNQKINSLANVDPNLECTRIINILNDYFNERKKMYDELAIGDGLEDPFKSGTIFVAAKEYFSDYLYKNNIDLNNIRNKDIKNRLIEFAKNPVETFSKEYNKNNNIFVAFHHEDMDEFQSQFEITWENLHSKEAKRFVDDFNNINNQTNGYNKGKNILNIIGDNKGGIWERYIAHSTSNEYKSLVNAISDAVNKDSVSFGDFAPVRFYAKKYLEYKLRNKSINDLNTLGKKRVEFCKTILKSFNELDDKYEIKINPPVEDISAPSIINKNNIEIHENEFQNQIKENIKTENDSKIEDNEIIEEKEIIEVKNNIEIK